MKAINYKNGIAFILALFLSFISVTAQVPTYSESIPYKPRESQTTKKSKKEKKKMSSAVSMPTLPTPNADVDREITIPVSVFDNDGQFVKGLNKSDFTVLVDNQEAKISSLEPTEQQITVLLLIDTSPSSPLEEIQKHAMSLVEQLKANSKVMVVQFGSSLKVLSAPTDNRAETIKAIRKSKIDDGTSLYDAIQILFRRIVPQITGRTVVILLSDGVDTTSRDADYASSLAEAEKNSVTIFPVYFDTLNDTPKGSGQKGFISPQQLRQLGISLGVRTTPKEEKEIYEIGRSYLTDLLILSGGRVLAVKDISSKRIGIAEELSFQYHLRFALPKIFTDDQRLQIRVRVNRPNLIIRARGSYIARAK